MTESRWILHLDLDQFIAAVEIRRRPELRGLPVVVGGDGDPTRRRQVVATASYEARAFGVRSGMPLSTALRRCPDAVFLPSDRAAYDAASAEVWDLVRQQPLLVEVWGWDEGFLGTDVDDPIALAHELRRWWPTRQASPAASAWETTRSGPSSRPGSPRRRRVRCPPTRRESSSSRPTRGGS